MTAKKLKIRTDIVRTYYVEMDGWIYGGPFDSKAEAQACLDEAKQRDASNLNNATTTTAKP